ncbi:MAG: ImmA/IrrE family metallo-endopeptidase, partial [Bacillota bacterium]
KKLDDEGNPVKKDGKYVYEKQKYTYYGFVSVFDISQTEGKPLPTLMDKVKGNKDFAKLLMNNLDKIGKEIGYDIKLEPYKGSSGGYHSRNEKKIRINSNNKTTSLEQATTLIHELAHAFAHGKKEAQNYTTERKELEAESINYVVSKRFGLDTKNRSVGYITSWATDDNERNEKFKKLLDSVTKHSGKLIDTIEKTLSKELKLLKKKNKKKNKKRKMTL